MIQKMGKMAANAAFALSIFVFSHLISFSVCDSICNIKCDSTEGILTSPRIAANITWSSSSLVLHISDEDNMAYGTIENGKNENMIWLERSFDGGNSNYEGILGNEGSTKTKAFNIDNPSQNQIGSVRICGNFSNVSPLCTSWARSKVNSESPIDAAATALMQYYSESGVFKTTGWWNSANALVSMINYIKISERKTYSYVINRTFEENKHSKFTNKYIDDTLWWGLTWVEAYDFLGHQKYLEMAKFDANYAAEYIDSICRGGVWWTSEKTYKNAVTNELFIKLTASLHNRIPGDTKYLHLATDTWTWFKSSGMINAENLINDGLTENCENNEGIMWTYNQGVILGALVQLNKATGENHYLEEAVKIADAVLNSTQLNPDGILQDYGCETIGKQCDPDQPSFKGIFIRNLAELDRVLEKRPYRMWISIQADTIYRRNRNSLDQYGIHWNGPFDKADAARQHSALDALNAAKS